MRRLILVVGLLLVCAGCASVPRTTTYQTTEWREVIETPPPVTCVVQADIPSVFPGAKKGRKYLNIGYKPVNPNRALAPGEMEFILSVDTYVETIDRDGKHVRGWLLAGERVIGVPTANPDYYKAIWIRRCGNDLFNEEKIAIFIRVRREPIAAPQSTKRWTQQLAVATPVQCRPKSDVLNAFGSSFGGWGGSNSGKLGAGLGAFAGWIVVDLSQSVVNFFRGDAVACITVEGSTVVKAAVAGGIAAIIAPSSSTGASSSGPGGNGRTLPGNGGGNTLPGNSGGHTMPFN